MADGTRRARRFLETDLNPVVSFCVIKHKTFSICIARFPRTRQKVRNIKMVKTTGSIPKSTSKEMELACLEATARKTAAMVTRIRIPAPKKVMIVASLMMSLRKSACDPTVMSVPSPSPIVKRTCIAQCSQTSMSVSLLHWGFRACSTRWNFSRKITRKRE